jgi:beta-phosphoglucomutase
MSYQGIIFDVDGVLVDSPHERAWRESLQELMETDWLDIQPATSYLPERFTTAVYQEFVAGKPRMSGARAALEYFGVPQVERHAREYAELKQDKLIELVEIGQFEAFPDALRFILAVKGMGIPVGAASSSKNANLLLHKVRLDTFAEEQGLQYPFIRPRLTLLALFDANVCGRDFPKGKPHPEIFLTAAEELGVAPEGCIVVEDAVSGIEAAKAGGMAALGVARLNDEALLEEADADLVVTTLDDVSLDALREGRLERKGTQ